VAAGLVLGAPAHAQADGEAGPLIGEFVYFADAATFRPCGGEARVPVATEAAYLDLERAYLDARAAPQAPLMIVIDGMIAEREGMEGGPRPMLVAERLAGVVPGERCDSPLAGTYWRLLSIGGTPVSEPQIDREPHILFDTEEARYSATAGCNMMMGGYTAELPEITIDAGAMTMMACPPPIDAQEEALVEALRSAETARIVGPTLELFDGEGAARAFFQAARQP